MLKITTTQDCLPTNFRDAVRMLTRPYIPISEIQARRLDVLTKNCGDIFIYKGKRMTWGQADGGWALMPLADQ
jgi:hypothetical protein